MEAGNQPNRGNKLLDACMPGEQDTTAGRDSPGRLLNLWDIMNLFDVSQIAWILYEINAQESRLLLLKMGGQGATRPSEEIHKAIKELFVSAKNWFGIVGLEDCVAAVDNASHYLPERMFDVSTGTTVLNRLKGDIMQALMKRQFLRVADDRPQCVDNEMAFGQAVFDAFPSARDDIKAAYNCLAAECPTAAVFHLMRAAEIGLRALAFDRSVKIFKNKKTMLELPLELASWDQIIKELEEAETAIQGYPQTLAREQQFKFYHGANMQFRAFKNIFRNSIMHSRESFDRDEATSVSHKIGEFMQILAFKIKEGDQTPTIWV